MFAFSIVKDKFSLAAFSLAVLCRIGLTLIFLLVVWIQLSLCCNLELNHFGLNCDFGLDIGTN